MDKEWYQQSFKRNLIDMHIPDWNPEFLSLFDPVNYARQLKISGVDTAIIYAGSCLGICYWPTKYGYMHKNLSGRDILGETINECKKSGLKVVVYYNIWSRWAYDTHPDWRMVNSEGKGQFVETGERYGLCCPNTGYYDYVKNQITDLCENYQFEGLWIDMIGWFGVVCCCDSCRERYKIDTGSELPEIVDWENLEWVLFQRKRQAWQADFAAMITKTAKSIKPNISVVHQCTSWLSGYSGGASYRFFDQSDYLAGDFYMGAVEQSFICKFLNAVTVNKPIEFMVSRCPDLTDHTTTKSIELLEAQMYSSIANNAAFVFIDAIDPVGTINGDIYKTMGEILGKSEQYQKYIDIDSKMLSDVAVYINIDNYTTINENGKHLKDVQLGRNDLLNDVYCIVRSLIYENIPFDILTPKNLDRIHDFQAVVIADGYMLDNIETETFSEFVKKGGNLYLSRYAGAVNGDGVRSEDFRLSNLFGIRRLGDTRWTTNYMAPTENFKGLFPGNSKKYPLTVKHRMTEIEADSETEVLATLTLPYTDPEDINRFGSAISNPPGIETNTPVITRHKFGEGYAYFSAGRIETITSEIHRNVFCNILKEMLVKRPVFETNAPKQAEVILFEQAQKNRYEMNIINFQDVLPAIPLYNIQVNVDLNGKIPKSVFTASGEQLHFSVKDSRMDIEVPKVAVFEKILIQYES